MPAEARPELLIIGDSHSIALKAGCDASGVMAELLSFSGNLWHHGHLGMHRKHGLWSRSAVLQKRLRDVAQRLDCAFLPKAELPVLTTFGFHLGRMVPQFNAGGHCAEPGEFMAKDDGHFVSQAMLAAYAAHFRQNLVQMLKRLSRYAPLVAVTPPLIHETGNYPEFTEAVAAMIAAEGLTLINPCEAFFGQRKALPARFLTADGGHGNAEYGAMVIQLLRDRGFVAAGSRAAV